MAKKTEGTPRFIDVEIFTSDQEPLMDYPEGTHYAAVHPTTDPLFFATEEEACAIQQFWRSLNGRDPITGLVPNDCTVVIRMTLADGTKTEDETVLKNLPPDRKDANAAIIAAIASCLKDASLDGLNQDLDDSYMSIRIVKN